MATFPSELTFDEAGYGFTVAPSVTHTQYASGASRQRFVMTDNDDVFNVTMQLTAAQLETFEDFVLDTLNNGADEYTGTYYVSDVATEGTLQIIDGEYEVDYVSGDLWSVSYSFEVKGRTFTEEASIYALVNEYEGFNELCDIIKATEQAINFNDL